MWNVKEKNRKEKVHPRVRIGLVHPMGVSESVIGTLLSSEACPR